MSMFRICALVFVMLAGPCAADRALIAVATNFAQAAGALAEAFEAAGDHRVDFAFGSTGKLYAQIIQGAPFDGFLAADQARPALLAKAGLSSAPVTYAHGTLVWWRPDGLEQPPDLFADQIRRVAIANPELAPYGVAARASLQGTGQWEGVQDKLVMGENIGQTFAMISTGNADVGLVALSYVLSDRNTGSRDWVAVDHAPILQDAVVLERGHRNPAALAFFDFLASARGAEILQGFGYGPVPQ